MYESEWWVTLLINCPIPAIPAIPAIPRSMYFFFQKPYTRYYGYNPNIELLVHEYCTSLSLMPTRTIPRWAGVCWHYFCYLVCRHVDLFTQIWWLVYLMYDAMFVWRKHLLRGARYVAPSPSHFCSMSILPSMQASITVTDWIFS